MTAKHETLAAALAAFQQELPAVHKGATGQVPGKRLHKYADLADMSAAVLPALGKQGLSWMTLPTVNEAGQFVLQYELLHESGQSRTGSYPLPTGTAWEIGSSLTYARRYCLSAVTGVAADEDDDGAAANDAGPARQNGQQRQRPRAVQDEPAPADTVDNAKADLLTLVSELRLDPPKVNLEYAARMKLGIGDETDPKRIRAFTKALRDDPGKVMGTAGAAA